MNPIIICRSISSHQPLRTIWPLEERACPEVDAALNEAGATLRAELSLSPPAKSLLQRKSTSPSIIYGGILVDTQQVSSVRV